MSMECAYHPGRDPVGACVACGKLICVECRNVIGGKAYCQPCSNAMFASAQDKVKPVASSTTTVSQSKVEAPASAAVNLNTSAIAGSTTESGQGSASLLPAELSGWNWGAFFLNWIWGIANSVWIAFLVFVPLLGLVWIFVLGAKGNEWAWQHKKWDSIEHFRKTQKTWAKVGLIVFLAVIALYILYFIVVLLIGGYFALMNS